MTIERIAFGRRRYIPDPSPPVRPATRRSTYAPRQAAAPILKPAPARPGKRTPTKPERAWMAWISAHGCLACRIDGNGHVHPEVHHMLRGGRRIGHLFTLPLCPGHHQDGKGRPGLIARHPWRARFEDRYGTEAELLAGLQDLYRTTTEGAPAP